MIILNEYAGSKINLDFNDGNLHEVLQRISDTARKDGVRILVDQRIDGRITLKLDEPWNHILVEILAGLNFLAIVERNTIMICLPR
jgi:hypothetical protein